jgi:hypothetical protein
MPTQFSRLEQKLEEFLAPLLMIKKPRRVNAQRASEAHTRGWGRLFFLAKQPHAKYGETL